MHFIVPDKIAVDIFLYANRYMPLSDGFSHDIYEIWFRDPKIQNISDVDRKVNAIIRYRSVSAMFALFWGMMISTERAMFINNAIERARIFREDLQEIEDI